MTTNRRDAVAVTLEAKAMTRATITVKAFSLAVVTTGFFNFNISSNLISVAKRCWAQTEAMPSLVCLTQSNGPVLNN